VKTHDPLRNIPLFKAFNARQRKQITGDLVEARYRKGQVIFREGDPADHFYILKEGAVKCVKSSADGKDITLKVLMPGDLFCCEAAALENACHPGCARPMGDVTVFRLNKQRYFDMLRRNPGAALDVIQYLGKRLNEAQEHAKVLALDRAERRMAALLLNLASRTGIKEPAAYRLTVRLTRKDLADMAGITTETAIRIMSRFKRDKLVSGTASSLAIHDLPRLERLADSLPRHALEI
jgi:CRP/FNR family transcriptional regulator, cyclic AMP receptor protein